MNQNAFKEEKAYTQKIASDRTFEEQVSTIDQCGNHGVSQVLRNAVLTAHGIRNPKDKAFYGLIFGCYRPFTTPFLLRDYIKLLDLLGIDYTWFDREYCCGWPLIVQNPQKAAGISEGFNRRNISLAEAKEVQQLVYCCIGCAYAAKHFIREAPEKHLYILDLILNVMEKRKPKILPERIGYYEGCHSFHRAHFPGVQIDWPRYRRFLGMIEGLSIEDLSTASCCKRGADQILHQAQGRKLDKILCSCNGCYRTLDIESKGKIQILSFPEILLRCMGEGTEAISGK